MEYISLQNASNVTHILVTGEMLQLITGYAKF